MAMPYYPQQAFCSASKRQRVWETDTSAIQLFDHRCQVVLTDA